MIEISQEPYQTDFSRIYQMIEEASSRTWKEVNKSLISLYWNIGKYVSTKAEKEDWGQGIVEQLSNYILLQRGEIKGFSARNIWRMKQFYETYKDHEKLSTALTEFPISTGNMFKDVYTFEFLDLPETYKENDLRKALLQNLRKFLIEMGPDFSLMGEEYVVQVGGKDFRIDLLLHNRALNCLVAVELKITEFQPEYLGKIQFYLEALDRDVKKIHENPSIGILICKTKDDEVVEYALSRNMSPTMIAEYETKFVDKGKLQRKLHELSEFFVDYNEINSSEPD